MEFFHWCHKLAWFFNFPMPLAQGSRDVPKNGVILLAVTSNHVQVRLGDNVQGKVQSCYYAFVGTRAM